MSKLIKISTAEQLQDIATNTHYRDEKDNITGNYVLTKDIDLYEISNFRPIGNPRNKFIGTFNGNGYVISNLTIFKEQYFAGLFGYIAEYARIENIQLVDTDITGSVYVGGIVGYMEDGTIKVNSDGCIVGKSHVGGLVGKMENGTVSGHNICGQVRSTGLYTGGLVGYMDNGLVTGCNDADVRGGSCVGGLVGKMWYGNLKGCNSGFISGYGKATKDLVGHSINGNIIHTEKIKEE